MQFWFHNLEEQDDVAVEQGVEEDDRGDEEEGDDDEEGEAGVHVAKKMRKKRGKNWGDDETASLIDFKREDHLGKIGAMRGSEEMTLTTTDRWKRNAKKMQVAGMQRDWKACRTRWNNLCNDYKCVCDFQRKTGNPNYFSLSHEDAKRLMPVKLNLKVFPVEYFNIMDEFLAKQASTSPTFLADSDAPEEEAYEEDPADGVDPPGDATQDLATVQPEETKDGSRENQRDAQEEHGSFNNQAALIDALLRNKAFQSIIDDKTLVAQTLPDEEEDEDKLCRAVLSKRLDAGLWWVKPRCMTTWSKFFMELYDPGRWKRKLRMEKKTFFGLCGILEAEICKQNTKFRRAVPVDVRLGVTLYKLFKNTDYSDLSDKFGIGEATAHDIVVQTTAAIVKCLRYKIRFPETAAEGVCDAQKRFLSIYASWPGSVHDMRVFQNSRLCHKIQARELLTVPREFAFDEWIEPYLVGDKGYQLQQHLMIPHLGSLLTVTEAEIKPKYLPNIIKSCCILHNFLIDVGETNINAEIKAWEKHIQALKEAEIFKDYGDPIVAEGEPQEDLRGPEDARENCVIAMFKFNI
ncbi:hypothetical protein SELMODRAFT_415254 [Selaginella moellendorffii]|uniref:Myb-like domain-containing protein n=1 Tax=Selaginella moellendorffii TaxID=88036 RepID=D8RVI4_SELML|nr:hypothetical protein SELMODRAFT_415254 [Selaginella moellendorffii]